MHDIDFMLNYLDNIYLVLNLNCLSYLYCIVIRGKGAMQKKVNALRELRRLLSRSEFPPVEAALRAGAVPLLVQCLSFGSPDEQVQRFIVVCNCNAFYMIDVLSLFSTKKL